MKLTHIRLLAKDYAACFRFYRDVMGFPAPWGDEESGYANFVVGQGTSLALFGRRPMADVVGTDGLPEDAVCQDRAMLIFETEDLPALVAELRARNARILIDVTDHPEWGIRAAYLRDPEGTLIELNSPLARSEWSAELDDKSRRFEQE